MVHDKLLLVSLFLELWECRLALIFRESYVASLVGWLVSRFDLWFVSRFTSWLVRHSLLFLLAEFLTLTWLLQGDLIRLICISSLLLFNIAYLWGAWMGSRAHSTGGMPFFPVIGSQRLKVLIWFLFAMIFLGLVDALTLVVVAILARVISI